MSNEMLSPHYPMIAPKPLEEHTPAEYHNYIKGLKVEPEKKPEVALKFKLTKKGKPSITLPRTRKPAWVFLSELEALSAEYKFPINELYNEAKKKALIIKDKKEVPK